MFNPLNNDDNGGRLTVTAAETATVWSVVGSGVIVAAFAVLAYDMRYSRP